MNKTVGELNKEKMYTSRQLNTLAKFRDKYLNVYPRHYEFWVDGSGYETVYEVRGISSVCKENFLSVEEILSR